MLQNFSAKNIHKIRYGLKKIECKDDIIDLKLDGSANLDAELDERLLRLLSKITVTYCGLCHRSDRVSTGSSKFAWRREREVSAISGSIRLLCND